MGRQTQSTVATGPSSCFLIAAIGREIRRQPDNDPVAKTLQPFWIHVDAVWLSREGIL